MNKANSADYVVDAVIIGGSLGAVQAARSLLDAGYSVLMTEECAWIGGQLTSQAVPPDEHPWIEEFGCTQRYRQYREAVREYYRRDADFDADACGTSSFDPGNSWVSRIAHPPALAHRLFMDSIRPELEGGKLILLTETRPIGAQVKAAAGRRTVEAVRLRNLRDGNDCLVWAEIFIDGTDQGDLLPLVGARYVTGAESRLETGEPAAPLRANPADMQPVTWVLSLGLNCGESPIEKPADYAYFRSLRQPYADHAVLSRFGPDGSTGAAKAFNIVDSEGELPLWSYRRIQFPGYFKEAVRAEYPEISLLNWPQNDYFMENIIGTSASEQGGGRKERAKELSLSYLYWLQTEAPRPKGERGYPEIGLVRDQLGSDDGAAQFPYIREGRRIRALRTVTARDVIARFHKILPRQKDSVGVGSYPIDLHITTESHSFTYNEQALPFEIPLSALIPRDMSNVLPASKNIGSTHLSNGCFRTHPVEWNIGEVVGHLAAYCLRRSIRPADVYRGYLADFQNFIRDRGVETEWPESVMPGH